jgi:hypothetical protein
VFAMLKKYVDDQLKDKEAEMMNINKLINLRQKKIDARED